MGAWNAPKVRKLIVLNGIGCVWKWNMQKNDDLAHHSSSWNMQTDDNSWASFESLHLWNPGSTKDGIRVNQPLGDDSTIYEHIGDGFSVMLI